LIILNASVPGIPVSTWKEQGINDSAADLPRSIARVISVKIETTWHKLHNEMSSQKCAVAIDTRPITTELGSTIEDPV